MCLNMPCLFPGLVETVSDKMKNILSLTIIIISHHGCITPSQLGRCPKPWSEQENVLRDPWGGTGWHWNPWSPLGVLQVRSGICLTICWTIGGFYNPNLNPHPTIMMYAAGIFSWYEGLGIRPVFNYPLEKWFLNYVKRQQSKCILKVRSSTGPMSIAIGWSFVELHQLNL